MYIHSYVYIHIIYTYIFVVIVNECPVPEDIPIGSVKYTSLTFKSIAKYSCPSDYVISGFQQSSVGLIKLGLEVLQNVNQKTSISFIMI